MSRKTNGYAGPSHDPVIDEQARRSLLDQAIEETSSHEHFIKSVADLKEVSKNFADSAYFKEAMHPTQAFTKIMAGMEFGFGPFASMTRIYLVDGKPTLDGLGISIIMRRAGCRWKFLQHDAKGCIIQLREPDGTLCDPLGFVEADARKAELLILDPKTNEIKKDNWRKYPRAMYRWRALSENARSYVPEIFGGLTPYVAEELGALTDENGVPTGAHVAPNTTLYSIPAVVPPPPVEQAATPPQEEQSGQDQTAPPVWWDPDRVVPCRVPSDLDLNSAAYRSGLTSREEIIAAWNEIKAQYAKLPDGEDFFKAMDRQYGFKLDKPTVRTILSYRRIVVIARRFRDDNMFLWLQPQEEGAHVQG